MNNPRTGIPKTKLVNSMRKIIFSVRYKCADMDVSTWQTYTFPSGNMKIPGHFIQNQTAVDAASIVRPIGIVFSRRKLAKVRGKAAFPQQILHRNQISKF